MSELLDYDSMIVKHLEHIENRMERFALQNYAAAGAVLLAHFGTTQVPLPFVKWTIVTLGLVFTVAIILNAARFHNLWKLHRIARDCWLAEQDKEKFREACHADKGVKEYLGIKELPLLGSYGPLIIINFLPAVVVAFWGLR
jgi:hypothetical protein